MKREIYAKLLDWKSRKDHKPLVLDGAVSGNFASAEIGSFSFGRNRQN